MSRLTLRLPESLHHQLEELATHEAVSLNQYIVYALTRQTTLAYTIQSIPEKAIADQRTAYSMLLQNLGTASFEKIQKTLDERKSVEPEHGLTPEAIERLKKRIKKKR
jgi:uncharacterized protein YpbB